MKHNTGISRITFIVMGFVMLSLAALACGSAQQPAQSGGAVVSETEAPAAQTEVAAQATEAAPAAAGVFVDACTLLTQADAEAIFGGAPGPGVNNDMSGIYSSCKYTSQDGSQSLTLLIWPFQTPDEAVGQLMSAISGSNGGKTVDGVGDHAEFDTGNSILNFTKGSYFLALKGELTGGKDVLATLTPLAQTVMGRLPQ